MTVQVATAVFWMRYFFLFCLFDLFCQPIRLQCARCGGCCHQYALGFLLHSQRYHFRTTRKAYLFAIAKNKSLNFLRDHCGKIVTQGDAKRVSFIHRRLLCIGRHFVWEYLFATIDPKTKIKVNAVGLKVGGLPVVLWV